MSLSRKHRIVAAVLLTVALVADAYEIVPVPSTYNTTQASLGPLVIIKGRKVFYPDGTFKGCEAGGNNCWIVTTLAGSLNISSEGLSVQ
jgi:hypothetical protein